RASEVCHAAVRFVKSHAVEAPIAHERMGLRCTVDWLVALPSVSRPARDRIAGTIFGALIVLTAVSLTWTLRQAWAVFKLARGGGDAWFLASDGRRWFRMDEHRFDVPLAEIAPDLQHAFVAIEDHRFYSHLGIDPIAVGRAVVRDIASRSAVEGGSTL